MRIYYPGSGQNRKIRSNLAGTAGSYRLPVRQEPSVSGIPPENYQKTKYGTGIKKIEITGSNLD